MKFLYSTLTKRHLLILVLCLASIKPIKAQWNLLNGPYVGDNINGLVTMGDDIYANSFTKGLYVSHDTGKVWNPVTNFFANKTISILDASSTTLFAVTNTEIYKSLDKGVTWQLCSIGLPSITSISSFAVDSTRIYVCVNPSRMYVSNDNGDTWTDMNNGLSTNTFMSSLHAKGNLVYGGSFVNGMFLYDANIGTWTNMSNALSCQGTVNAIQQTNDKLYIGLNVCNNTSLHNTTDTCKNWNAVNDTIFKNSSVRSIESKDSMIWVGNENFNYSFDNGNTWHKSNNGLDTTFSSYKNVILYFKNKLFLATTRGLYYSTDYGLTWNKSSFGFSGALVSHLLNWNNKVYATSFQNGIHIYNTANQKWNHVATTALPQGPMTSIVELDSILYLGTHNNKLYKSIDQGYTWIHELSDTTFNQFQINGIAKSGSNLLASIAYKGFYKSTDHGLSWTKYSTIGSYQAFYNQADTLICGGGGSVKIFTNYLTTGVVANNITLFDISSFCTNDSLYFMGSNGDGVFVSYDKGHNWSKQNTGLANLNVLSLSSVNHIVFAGTAGSGIYISIDNGQSWTPMNSGLGNLTINELKADKDTIYAATNAGVYTYNASNLTNNQTLIDLQPALQIYPNPATNAIQIKGIASNAELIAIDQFGQIVLKKKVTIDTPV